MFMAIYPPVDCVTHISTMVHCDNAYGACSMHFVESYIHAGVAMKDNKKKHSDDRSKEKNDKQKYDEPNPPRTTTGGITAPKFGSAGGGGAELEPGPERD